MTQAVLIRTLQTLGPRFPYGPELKKQFGIVVPTAMPLYQVEYLYKYALAGQLNGVSDIHGYASKKASELFKEFPWLSMKYDEVKLPGTRTDKTEVVYVDGTIVFSDKYKMYDGYVGGKVVSRCKSIDKVKVSLTKFHKITEFTVLEKS